jgi:hypothetical protein
MTTFNVVFDIEVEGSNPLEAAKEVERWIKAKGAHWQYYVQNVKTKEIYSVDLQEEDRNAVLPVKNYEPLIK